jgi:ABC-type Fe3+ transport system permease subunit
MRLTVKPLPKAACIAGSAAILVFATVFLIGYVRLLAHQPPHEAGLPSPPDVTSNPPSAAWVMALPCSLVAFFGVFFVALIVLSFWSRAHSQAET